MLEKLRAHLTSRNLGIILFVATAIASIQKYFLQNINNYYIFTRSFDLLTAHENLYAAHPALFADRFLYSPTFAVAMASFYFMPDLAGVVLWNLLNLTFFFLAIKTVAGSEKKCFLILALASVELFGSIQNNQSNPLVTALILFAFDSFEKRRIPRAALFVAALFFIKIYGFAAAVFAIFHSEKFKFAKWLFLWLALLLFLPLLVISAQELGWQYENWFAVIKGFKTGAQYSMMGLIERWTGREILYLPVQLLGLLIFLAPLVYFKRFSDLNFRRQILASLLIFLVIFNQSAESPTYVTAVTGTAIWFADVRKNTANYVLIVLVMIFTSLASTSLFPARVRHDFFEVYGLKVVPCLLVWLKIQYDLHFESTRQNLEDGRQN